MTNKITVPKVSEELAYLCGVIAGDGSITYRANKKEWSLCCSGNPHDEKEFYIEIVCPLMEKVFGQIIRPKLLSGGTYGIRVYSRELCEYLRDEVGLLVGKKYDGLCIPELFLHNKTLATAFIRGVFDTDGCISFKKRHKGTPYYPVVSMCSKSSSFVESIAKLLRNQGFIVVVHHRLNVDVRFAGPNPISVLNLNGVENFFLWESKINFWSPKHKRKIEEWKKANIKLNRNWQKHYSRPQVAA